MQKDHHFLSYMMYCCVIGGFLLAIIHTMGLFTGWEICTWASLPLWGNMPYSEIALPNLNIGLLLIGIGLGLSMRNRAGWWISNMMTTVLFSLSFAFAFTWIVYLKSYNNSIEVPEIPILPIIQSFIFCLAIVVISASLLLYLFTKEVKALFHLEEPEEVKTWNDEIGH